MGSWGFPFLRSPGINLAFRALLQVEGDLLGGKWAFSRILAFQVKDAKDADAVETFNKMFGDGGGFKYIF